MSEYPGLRAVPGPLSTPRRLVGPGPSRCGCLPDEECGRCDGSANDGSAVVLAMAVYRRQHPTTSGDAA